MMVKFRLNWAIVLATIVVTAIVTWYLLLPQFSIGYVKVPKGYAKVATGELSSYNNRVLTGQEILELKQRYPEKVFLVRVGKEFVGIEKLHRVFGSKGGKTDFCTTKSYGIIAIGKSGTVEGFAIQSS